MNVHLARLTMLCMLAAQGFAQTGTSIPIRALRVDARSAAVHRLPADVYELTEGRAMFASQFGGVLTLCDATLTTCRTLVDSTALTPATIPMRRITVMPFATDSMYIVDMGASALLVTDATGKTSRIAALPAPTDASSIALPIGGPPRVDPLGRLVYRARYKPVMPRFELGAPIAMPSAPDSFPIVRASFDTRVVDTIAVVHAPIGSRMTSSRSADGKMEMRTVRQPLPIVDDWAMLSDGTIAVVRGQDYHIDWIDAKGVRSSTAKMTMDWRRLTDIEKQSIVDSTQRTVLRMREVLDSMRAAQSTPALFVNETVVPASELPDYYPPFRTGSVRADRDGRVWVLPTTSVAARGGLLFDVIDRSGAIVERVQLPPDCNLAGFGPGGVVYYVSYARGDDAGHLFRARIVR